MSSRVATSTVSTSNVRNMAFGMPAWKLGLLQDVLILGVLGVGCLFSPSSFYSIATWYGTTLHKGTNFWVSSALSDFLLKIIGMIALGFCIPLARAIRNNDIDFAVSVAYYHLIVAALGGMLVWTSPAQSISRILLPFVAHDAITTFLLFSSIPNSSPLWNALSKIHLA